MAIKPPVPCPAGQDVIPISSVARFARVLFSFGYNEAFTLVTDQLISVIKVGQGCPSPPPPPPPYTCYALINVLYLYTYQCNVNGVEV